MSEIRYLDLRIDEIFNTQEETDKFMDSYAEMVQRSLEKEGEDVGAFALFLLFQHYTNNRKIYARFDALFERIKTDGKKLETSNESGEADRLSPQDEQDLALKVKQIMENKGKGNEEIKFLREALEESKEEVMQYRGLCVRLWSTISDLHWLYTKNDQNTENTDKIDDLLNL